MMRYNTLLHKLSAAFAISTALAGSALATASEDAPANTNPDLKQGILFSKIAEQGHPRFKKIIAMMRQSREGEKIYRYASRKGLRLNWGNASTSDGGYIDGTIRISPALSNEAAGYTIAHEVAHGFQDKSLNWLKYQRGPLITWQISQLNEIGACAYAAHYAAKWKDETRKALDIPEGFGDKTAQRYQDLPAPQRDFYKNAVLPCAQEIKEYEYESKHMQWARYTLDDARLLLKIIQLNAKIATWHPAGYDASDDRSIFDTIRTKDKARLLSKTLTTLLDREDVPSFLKSEKLPGRTLRRLTSLTEGSKEAMDLIYRDQLQFAALRTQALRTHNQAMREHTMRASQSTAP